jgi:hypothetical protein
MTAPRRTSDETPVAATFPFLPNPAYTAWGDFLQRIEPVAKSVACFQFATLSFAAQRARARLETASRVAACRSPRDLAEVQTDFWRQAGDDYAGLARQWTALWQQSLSIGLGMAGTLARNTEASDGFAPPRDVIRVPATGSEEAPRKRGDDGRRAA